MQFTLQDVTPMGGSKLGHVARLYSGGQGLLLILLSYLHCLCLSSCCKIGEGWTGSTIIAVQCGAHKAGTHPVWASGDRYAWHVCMYVFMFVCLFLGACPAVLLPRVFGMWPVVFLTRGLPFASPYLAGCVDVQEYWHGLHSTRWTGSTCSIASRQAHVLSEGHGVGLHGFYVCIHVCMYVCFFLPVWLCRPEFSSQGAQAGAHSASL